MIPATPSPSGAKLALLAAKARSESPEAHLLASDPIAIIGIGCRFPGGASSPEAFWEMLRTGTDAVREIPRERWDSEQFYSSEASAPGRMNTRWAGVLDNSDQFDPAFFGISPREAAIMDPQQRLLLEVAWEALWDAGCAPGTLTGSATGVCVAVSSSDYARMLGENLTSIGPYTTAGSELSMGSGRISFLLDLRGPSVVVDTACSSSLIAIHMASQGLRRGETRMALAGGVTLKVSPEHYVGLAKSGMLAPDGRCKTFDARANGFVPGEGCGIVVLKRLADALADGDRIYALIRGTASNQDGRTSVITAPSGPAQQQVVRASLENARVNASEITYVETHGTGTSLGDPIEVEALTAVLNVAGGLPCALGALKTNIGHLEVTAGVAGLIKASLALHHEEIPANLHFQSLNSNIALEGTRFYLPTSTTPWKRGGRARFAGVSAFGFSGTNGHIILEEAPLIPARRTVASETSGAVLFPVSARTPEALSALAERYQEFLGSEVAQAHSIAEISATVASRRDHYEERLAVIASSREELRLRLRDAAEGRVGAGIVRGRAPVEPPQTVFLFSGQGSQWAQMGHSLMRQEPVFRAAIEECEALLKPHTGWSLTEVLAAEEGQSQLQSTSYAQPAICAVEIALARLLASWGVVPAMVIGHSLGEIAAAHISGALSLAEAMRLIAHRGRIMQAASGKGRMVSVSLPADEVRGELEPYSGRVTIAAINGWQTTVVSGEREAVEALTAQWRTRGVEAHALPVDYAFHSEQMTPFLPDLEQAFGRVDVQSSRIPLISTVAGGSVNGAELTAAYWVRAVRQPVLYRQAVEAAIAGGAQCFVEIGPHAVLARDTAETVRRAAAEAWPVIATLRRGRSDRESLLETVSRLYIAGHKPRWEKIAGGRGPVIALPSYPYQRQRYWLDAPKSRAIAPESGGDLFHLREVDSPVLRGRVFETRIDLRATAFLNDHVIGGAPVFPFTGFVELALQAAHQAGFGFTHGLSDFTVSEPLVLSAEDPVRLQVVIEAERVQVFAKSSAEWRQHAAARLESVSQNEEPQLPAVEEAWAPLDAAVFYERASRRGHEFGPAFRAIRSLRQSGAVIEAEIAHSPNTAQAEPWIFHPALLDACLQSILAGDQDDSTTYMPVAIDSLCVVRPAGSAVRCRLAARPVGSGAHRGLSADFVITDPDGNRVAFGRAFHVRPARRLSGAGVDSQTLTLRWQPAEAVAATRTSPQEVLIVGDGRGFERELAASLESEGIRCEVQERGVANSSISRHSVLIYAIGNPSAVDGADPVSEQEMGCRSLLELLQSITGRADSSMREIWVVTRDAQRVLLTDNCAGFAQATVWGLARTAALEHPALQWIRCDLDPSAASNQALVQAIRRGAPGDEFALRAGQSFVPRLEALESGAAQRPSRLVIQERGSVSSLGFDAVELGTIPPDGVEIEVRASALNFRDVMNALGAYPGDAGQLGAEFCGRVRSVGSNVSGYQPGDRVMGIGWGSLSDLVIARPELLTRVPEWLSDEEAATLPNVFATAFHCLVERAHLRPGERVLIHAAAGGVGLMATQLAQHLGAEVYATAGSERKRRLLRERGVRHVFDSRSASFAQEILEATGGEGVDVALNSLTGALIDATFSAMRRGGRFVEIGKTDIRTTTGVSAWGKDLEYHVVDLGEFVDGAPARIAEHFRHLQEYLASGAIRPLPYHLFRFEDAVAAFRFMERASHVGKIVLQHRAGREFDHSGTWMITGGLGALGLEFGEWLASHGAARLVLVGRNLPNDAALARIEKIRNSGVAVEICTADVGSDDAAGVLDAILRDSQPPVRGIAHLAGVTDDGVIAHQTWERFAGVFAPKVRGGWLLHHLASKHGVPHLLLFSSISALLGSPGQSSYAAANEFLDALAHYRASRGEPALSINWGAWSESGMAARLNAQGKRLGLPLIRAMSAKDCLEAMPLLARSGVSQGAVFSVDPQADNSPALSRLDALTASRKPPAARDADRKTRPATIAERMQGLSRQAARGLLIEYLRDEARLVIGLPETQPLDERQPLMKIGLDSLMALEVRNRVAASLGRPLSATLLFDYPTLGALADFLLPSKEEHTSEVQDQTLDEIAALSDEEAERLLEQELDEMVRRS